MLTRNCKKHGEISRPAWKVFFLCFFVYSVIPIVCAEPIVEKWGVFELTFNTTKYYGNPYTDVSLSAVFEGPNESIKIEGFWDGKDIWKIRMAPTEAGKWKYITHSTD